MFKSGIFKMSEHFSIKLSLQTPLRFKNDILKFYDACSEYLFMTSRATYVFMFEIEKISLLLLQVSI